MAALNKVAGVFLMFLLTGCNEDEGNRRPPELPLYFLLNAVASTHDDDLSVECSLDFIVEVTGEVSRTNEVLAIMGGGANRSLMREDGSGVEFWAEAFYPIVQMLHLLPNRVQLVNLDFPPDGPPSSSRFWDELRFFDGFIDQEGVISGEWLCAPLNTEYGGIDDDSVFADGTWETVAIGSS